MVIIIKLQLDLGIKGLKIASWRNFEPGPNSPKFARHVWILDLHCICLVLKFLLYFEIQWQSKIRTILDFEW